MPRQASSLSLGAFARERGREEGREGGWERGREGGREGGRKGGRKGSYNVHNDHISRHGYCLTSLCCFGVRGWVGSF